MSKKKAQELKARETRLRRQNEFIAKSKRSFSTRFKYDKVHYINNYTNVLIGCRLHGYFETNPSNHLTKSGGCKECQNTKKKRVQQRKNYNTINERREKFLTDVKKKYNNQYSFNKMIFRNHATPIITTCKDHGDFVLCPAQVLLRGCKKCSYTKREENRSKQYNENYNKRLNYFINKSNEVHNYFYDYSKTKVPIGNNKSRKSIIICPNHGSFLQDRYNHLAGSGCPKCKALYSKEARNVLKKLINFLDIHNINYLFEDTEYKLNNKLYDLLIPDYKVCVEYNGSVWHPDYYVLSDAEWDTWKPAKGKAVSADDKMKYDQNKSRMLYNHNKARTWMITPSNADLYVQFIIEEIKKAL